MNRSSARPMRKTRPFAAFEWMVAFRYMIPNKKQAFTSVISIISFIGIMIGVWALIVVMSVMNGFRTELTNRILGVGGHLIIQPGVDARFDDYEDLVKRLSTVKGVKFVLPLVQGQGLAQGDSPGGTFALVRGVRVEDLQKLKSVSANIKDGALADMVQKEDGKDVYNVAIGQGMADQLGLVVGSQINIISPEGDATPIGVMPRMKSYDVAAIYKVGMSEYDSAIIFMPLPEAQLFFNQENTVQMLEVFVDDPYAVAQIKPELERVIGRNVFITDWQQRNETFFNALKMERTVMFLILSLIVLVAALNIISGLIMLVRDKSHDIAILRTMGARRGAVMRIFIMAGAVIGVSGTCFGVALGIVTCLNLERLHGLISRLLGVEVFNPDVYYLSQLPSRLDAGQTLMVVIMALILSFLATLLPAWRASRLDPVQALRYE